VLVYAVNVCFVPSDDRSFCLPLRLHPIGLQRGFLWRLRVDCGHIGVTGEFSRAEFLKRASGSPECGR
jgi:hypothetical protein